MEQSIAVLLGRRAKLAAKTTRDITRWGRCSLMWGRSEDI